MNRILSNATIKHSTTFSKNKFPQLYKILKGAMHQVMEKELMDFNQVSITTDHWTSRANKSYMSETLHYISPDSYRNSHWKCLYSKSDTLVSRLQTHSQTLNH